MKEKLVCWQISDVWNEKLVSKLVWEWIWCVRKEQFAVPNMVRICQLAVTEAVAASKATVNFMFLQSALCDDAAMEKKARDRAVLDIPISVCHESVMIGRWLRTKRSAT